MTRWDFVVILLSIYPSSHCLYPTENAFSRNIPNAQTLCSSETPCYRSKVRFFKKLKLNDFVSPNQLPDLRRTISYGRKSIELREKLPGDHHKVCKQLFSSSSLCVKSTGAFVNISNKYRINVHSLPVKKIMSSVKSGFQSSPVRSSSVVLFQKSTFEINTVNHDYKGHNYKGQSDINDTFPDLNIDNQYKFFRSQEKSDIKKTKSFGP